MPPALSTAMARNQPETSYARLHFKRLYIFAAPLHAVNKSVAGGMIIVYDTGYIRSRRFSGFGAGYLSTLRVWCWSLLPSRY